MTISVVRTEEGHRLSGGPVEELANRYLAHLSVRGFSPATVRDYAFGLLNFSWFLAERRTSLVDVVPTDLFDYLDWQAKKDRSTGAKVVRTPKAG